jgi:hypothetical protein
MKQFNTTKKCDKDSAEKSVCRQLRKRLSNCRIEAITSIEAIASGVLRRKTPRLDPRLTPVAQGGANPADLLLEGLRKLVFEAPESPVFCGSSQRMRPNLLKTFVIFNCLDLMGEDMTKEYQFSEVRREMPHGRTGNTLL